MANRSGNIDWSWVDFTLGEDVRSERRWAQDEYDFSTNMIQIDLNDLIGFYHKSIQSFHDRSDGFWSYEPIWFLTFVAFSSDPTELL